MKPLKRTSNVLRGEHDGLRGDCTDLTYVADAIEDTSQKIRLVVGDSTIGYTLVEMAGGQIQQYGYKYLCARMVRAYRRGAREVVTSAGDVLAMCVEAV